MTKSIGSLCCALRTTQRRPITQTERNSSRSTKYSGQSKETSFFKRTLKKRLATALMAVTSTAFAGASYADANAGSADINQDGMFNVATIEQQNVTPATSASIDQSGTSNTGAVFQSDITTGTVSSHIVQIGSHNSAVNEQQNVGYESEISVYQSGWSNASYVTQSHSSENRARVSQSGDLNLVTVIQQGGSALTEITQVGHANNARVSQLDGSLSVARIYQDGEYNQTRVSQEFDFASTVNTRQIGSNNLLDIVQGGTTQDFGESNINVSMEGNNNEIYVEQDFSFQWVDVTQSGNYNRIDIIEHGIESRVNVTSLNSDHNSDTIITGEQADGSSATVERNWTDNSTTYIFAERGDGDVYVEQSHSSAVEAVTYQSVGPFEDANASIRQVESTHTSASTRQEDMSGTATIEQTAGNAWSEATINQYDGNDLIASIYQTGTTEVFADIEQTNENNIAVIKQLGAINTDAHILQTGTSGYAEIVQTGIYNSASITQAGDGYSAAIHQGGANNNAHISQF